MSLSYGSFSVVSKWSYADIEQAKVCQNELNPNCEFTSPLSLRYRVDCAVAYMYLGLAIRTCLSAGFNREVRNPKDQRESWISKTWW